MHDDIPAARALYSAPWAAALTTAPLDTSHVVHVQGDAYRKMLSRASPSVLAVLEQRALMGPILGQLEWDAWMFPGWN